MFQITTEKTAQKEKGAQQSLAENDLSLQKTIVTLVYEERFAQQTVYQTNSFSNNAHKSLNKLAAILER